MIEQYPRAADRELTKVRMYAIFFRYGGSIDGGELFITQTSVSHDTEVQLWCLGRVRCELQRMDSVWALQSTKWSVKRAKAVSSNIPTAVPAADYNNLQVQQHQLKASSILIRFTMKQR